jgi:ferric-dicitrate binding protein FerR (iron transport regulator)
VVVSLDEGWCWASPGEGAAAALRVDMVAGSLTVQPGATALAVVEADGSVFIVVAAGDAHLERDGDRAPIARGTIVMIDPSGAAQSDSATDAEIESDPIVAENLALDAEL